MKDMKKTGFWVFGKIFPKKPNAFLHVLHELGALPSCPSCCAFVFWLLACWLRLQRFFDFAKYIRLEYFVVALQRAARRVLMTTAIPLRRDRAHVDGAF